MGFGHHGTSTNRTKTIEIPSSRNRLLHQMGGSQTTLDDHRKEHKGICMEGDHMQIRNPKSFRIQQ